MSIQKDYVERLYAGWLGKIIGVRFGAQVEGWEYETIKKIYGKLDGYVIDYNDFAADDDTNGPLFFIRALQDSVNTPNISAQDVAEALLNYAPFEHSFFWWGGYGISTEHTAYLNLRQGINAPQSGSVEHNGAAVAEQIGGQIFIEPWGLVTPNNPDKAAEFAKKAASVTHGGNGIYGGQFVATCVSLAFGGGSIHDIVDKALSYLPADSEYIRMATAVKGFYKQNPSDWRACFDFVHKNFGYDRYPGSCHIIPNSAVVILSLLYGEGNFDSSINICNMCGWDTDCNVANVGCIVGTLVGIEGIGYEKWIKPLHDQLTASSVIGYLNMSDISNTALYMASLGYMVAGEEMPKEYAKLVSNDVNCHFSLPYATHSMRVAPVDFDSSKTLEHGLSVERDDDGGYLKMVAHPLKTGESLKLYKKTHHNHNDFHDGRYEPSFSPLVYPGQTIRCELNLPDVTTAKVKVCLYALDKNGEGVIRSDYITLNTDSKTALELTLPSKKPICVEEIGVELVVFEAIAKGEAVILYMHSLSVSGAPCYTLDFSKESIDFWSIYHEEVTQFSHLKGLWYLEDGKLSGGCFDYGAAYTGHYYAADGTISAYLTPKTGCGHGMQFRVKGAINHYYAGFTSEGTLSLLKNKNGYKTMAEATFDWAIDKSYKLTVSMDKNYFTVMIDDKVLIEYEDKENPYLYGCFGAAVMDGSRCTFEKFNVEMV